MSLMHRHCPALCSGRIYGYSSTALQKSIAFYRKYVDTKNPDQSSQAGWALLFFAWVLVTTATLGSLFFSEVMKVPVCVLCWYQRIAMYPLVLILAIGLFPFDPRVVRYAVALAGAGWLIALFHVLLVAGIIPESVQPCVQGVPCSETHLSLLGFLNIPVLSLCVFTLIGILLFYAHRMESS
jgi:disulfide bond formation protein DsbB